MDVANRSLTRNALERISTEAVAAAGRVQELLDSVCESRTEEQRTDALDELIELHEELSAAGEES
ncbi:MAG: hypothetical protein ACRDIB_00435, partial [Ardenticatenaceae bacterium]